MGRRQKGNIGEHWDPRKLRRIREDGWFRQHEPEMIAAARQKVAAAASKAAPGRTSGSNASQSGYDEALGRATAIVARAMDLLRDVDRPAAPRPK